MQEGNVRLLFRFMICRITIMVFSVHSDVVQGKYFAAVTHINSISRTIMITRIVFIIHIGQSRAPEMYCLIPIATILCHPEVMYS